MADELTKKEIAKLDYESSIKEAADRMRFQQEIGLTVCKSLILVNGGAIIGLLTFIGNHPAVRDPEGLKGAALSFCIGIGCALFSLVFGYWGQEWLGRYRTSDAWNYQQDMKNEPRTPIAEHERTNGWLLMGLATALITTGAGMFINGAINAVKAIL